MKTKSLLMIAMLAAALQFAPAASNESANPGKNRWERRNEWMKANLSDDERAKLRAAHQKAIQDPVVQGAKEKMRQASKDFRDAMRSSMLKADPTIQPILTKIPERRERF